MEGDGEVGVGDRRLHQLDEIDMLGVFPGPGGHLEDDGGLLQLGRLGDPLDDLHIVDIECTDGVAARIGLFEHLFRCDQWHN